MQALSCYTFLEVLLIKHYHSPGNNEVSPQQYRLSCTPLVKCNPVFMNQKELQESWYILTAQHVDLRGQHDSIMICQLLYREITKKVVLASEKL